ncbi:hypothetical protein Y032_0042g511 [Ancylostoma ceylanicum]|uniref:Uncharacterized protein n=1 Tax=Ancylostoma ceylanicum TaxID=53326 RepID=A0A016UGL5_9BILA|nr:hypothetical protein Y032_0042g511 [Ancylostoma ceylanicum]
MMNDNHREHPGGEHYKSNSDQTKQHETLKLNALCKIHLLSPKIQYRNGCSSRPIEPSQKTEFPPLAFLQVLDLL